MFNLNNGLAKLGSKSQNEGVIILETKWHHLIDLQENETGSVIGVETSMELLNCDEPKTWRWRAFVFRHAKTNEYVKLEQLWLGQSTVSSGTGGLGVHKKAKNGVLNRD